MVTELTPQNVGDLGVANAKRLQETVKSLTSPATCVDLGVRLGVSSRILMGDGGNQVYGIEAIGCAPELADLLACPNYHFVSGDSVTTGILWEHGPVDLVVFDTFHFAEHILCELFAWWNRIKVGGWAVFHDTNWAPNQHDVYAGMTLPHVIDGIEEFFPATKEMASYPESFGMTFIKKDHPKEFAGRISDDRWREIFGVRRKVLNAVNLPIKTWLDVYE